MSISAIAIHTKKIMLRRKKNTAKSLNYNEGEDGQRNAKSSKKKRNAKYSNLTAGSVRDKRRSNII